MKAKNVLKLILGAAAVAAVTPYKVEKNEETGSVKVTSAVWSATVRRGDDGTNVDVKLLPALLKKDECCCEDECCCDDTADVAEDDEDGITIEVTVDGKDEPAEEAEPVAEAEAPAEKPEAEADEEPKTGE